MATETLIYQKTHSCPQGLTIPINNHNIISKTQIYKSKQSKVFLLKYAVNPNNDASSVLKIVMKVYRKKKFKPDVLKYLHNEIQYASMFDCPHLTSYYGAWETHDTIYILTEYAEFGDLFDFIFKTQLHTMLPHNELIGCYFYPVCLAVKYMHELDIAHLDIKPENVLLHSDGVKLTDFGFSIKVETDNMKQTFRVSPDYQAPCFESITSSECDEAAGDERGCEGTVISTRSIDPKRLDVWCLGRLLYEMSLGTSKFRYENVPMIKSKTMRKLASQMLDFTLPLTITEVVYTIEEYLATH